MEITVKNSIISNSYPTVPNLVPLDTDHERGRKEGGGVGDRPPPTPFYIRYCLILKFFVSSVLGERCIAIKLLGQTLITH